MLGDPYSFSQPALKLLNYIGGESLAEGQTRLLKAFLPEVACAGIGFSSSVAILESSMLW